MNFRVDRWRAAPRFPDGACPACFCRGLSAVRQAGRKPVSREGLPSSVRRSTPARSRRPLKSHGPVSTCSESSIFRTRSFRIRSAFFPQKSRSKSSPKIGRREINDIYAVSIGYRKSYGRFGTFEPLDRLYVGGPLDWPCGSGDGSVFSQMTVDK